MQVIPSKEQYEANIYENLHVQMMSFMGSCSEQMMENINKRDCEKAEGKRKFEVFPLFVFTGYNRFKSFTYCRFVIKSVAIVTKVVDFCVCYKVFK